MGNGAATVDLFDAHLHPEGLSDADLETLRFFGVRGVLATAHHTPLPATAKMVLKHFEELVKKQLPRLGKAGLQGYAALGVHPQALPRRGLSEILDALPEYFRGGQVVALGEIGLQTGDAAEEEAFVEQLTLARRLKLPVLVHTPTDDKARITRRTLSLLKESGIDPSRVLVDHADFRTVRPILECGYYAGLTVHPDGLRAERAVALVQKLGAKRLVLDTDAGDGAGDLVALARTASLLRKAKLSTELVEQVAFENARAWLKT